MSGAKWAYGVGSKLAACAGFIIGLMSLNWRCCSKASCCTVLGAKLSWIVALRSREGHSPLLFARQVAGIAGCPKTQNHPDKRRKRDRGKIAHKHRWPADAGCNFPDMEEG